MENQEKNIEEREEKEEKTNVCETPKRKCPAICKNPWLYVSIVLAILIFIVFYFNINLDIRCGECDTYFQGTTEETPLEKTFIAYAKDLGLNQKNFKKCYQSDKYDEEIKKDMADAEAAGIGGTPSFSVNGKILGGAYPYELFKAVIEYELGNKEPLEALEASEEYGDYYEDIKKIVEADKKDITTDDDPSLGDDNASVTIVEFTDYECTFCARHFEQTHPQIKSEYIDTGKVKYALRDLPLVQLHKNATNAAKAANCAREQGKYFEYHDKLFENQTSWSQSQ